MLSSALVGVLEIIEAFKGIQVMKGLTMQQGRQKHITSKA